MNNSKLVAIIDKYKTNTVFKCLAVNVAVLVFFLLVGPKFETNDDIGLEFIVSGAYGENSPYMVYTNYIIGVLLSTLYKLVPIVKWYVLFDFAILFSDFCVVSYVLDSRLNKDISNLIKYTMLIVWGYELYVNIQFMKVAAFTAIAGYMLLLLCVEETLAEKRTKIKKVVGAIGLIVIGSMIRFDVFVLTIPFFLLVATLIVYENRTRNICLKRIIKYIFITVVLVIITFVINKLSYSLVPDWREYKQWEEARSNAVDYAIPEYWEATEEYESLGLNSSDFYMLRGWMFGDPDFFTVDLMNSVANVKYPKGSKSINDILKEFFDVLLGRFAERSFQLTLFFILLYYLLSRRELCRDLAVIMAIAAAVAALAYCYKLDRVVNRVNVSLWMSLIMVIVFSFNVEKLELSIDNRSILLICSLFFIINTTLYINNYESVRERRVSNKQYKERTLFVADDSDRLYINDIGRNMFEIGWSGVFDMLPYGKNFGNVVDTAGWQVNSPIWQSAMRKKGVNNIFRDTLDKDIIYIFIDSRVSSFETYINEHYHPGAKYVKVREFSDGIGYYKLVSHIDDHALEGAEYVKSNDLSGVTSCVSLSDNNESILLSGTAYMEGISSYYQKVYVVVSDKMSSNTCSFEAMRKEVVDRDDDESGKYGDFEITINKPNIDFSDYEIEVDLLADGKLYSVPIDEKNTEE